MLSWTTPATWALSLINCNDSTLVQHPERSGGAVSATQPKEAKGWAQKAASFDCIRQTTPDSSEDADLK